MLRIESSMLGSIEVYQGGWVLIRGGNRIQREELYLDYDLLTDSQKRIIERMLEKCTQEVLNAFEQLLSESGI